MEKSIVKGFWLIYLIVVNVIDLTYGSISWSLDTRPTVFGKDMKLKCQLDGNTSLHRIRQWSRELNDGLLVNNGTSVNSSKYKEELDEDRRISILTVKLLDTNDVDMIYTCQHGFMKYKHLLSITKENFEYHPTSNISSVNHDHDNALILVYYDKVFPVPICQASYGEKYVTNILNITYVHSGLLYKVNISLLFHKTFIIINQQPVILDCYIGTENINTNFCISKYTCIEMQDTVVSDTTHRFRKNQTAAEFGHALFSTIFAFCVLLCVTFIIISKMSN